MKLKAFKKIKTYGILLITLSLFCAMSITQARNRNTQITNQPNNNDNAQEAQALESFLSCQEYKDKPIAEQLACILAACFCDSIELKGIDQKVKVKGHFSKFVKTLISFLENQENAAQLKKKYPSINIAAIIAALKKVENDKSSGQIVFKLKNYMSLFPEDFKNLLPAELAEMSIMAFTSRISQRLQDKS